MVLFGRSDEMRKQQAKESRSKNACQLADEQNKTFVTKSLRHLTL